jgi:AraC family transcriptional regulator
VDHIHDNPTGDLSLDALADVAALSRFHFHRIWRAIYGETAAQTVRRMRLHRAAVALVHGTAPMARIAADVGYPNLSSFARAFTDAYGTPPSAFRARGELRPFPPQSRSGDPLMLDVEIRTEAARHLAAVAHTGPYPEINRAFERLYAMLSARQLLFKTGQMVAVYYDDTQSTPAAELCSHAGVELEGPVEPPLETVVLPAGRHAVLRHVGPYAGLPAAYDQLFGIWLPASGEEPADSPAFEVYLNTPMDTAQEALVTEIHLPLR